MAKGNSVHLSRKKTTPAQWPKAILYIYAIVVGLCLCVYGANPAKMTVGSLAGIMRNCPSKKHQLELNWDRHFENQAMICWEIGSRCLQI